MPTPSRRPSGPVARLLGAAAVLSLVLSPTVAAQGGTPVVAAGGSPELDRARALLDKYQDPIVAVHDGYFSTVACVEYTKGGAEGSMRFAPGGMGVHFLNLQHFGRQLDPAKPQVLIYEPVGGKLRLAAAEWFVPTYPSPRYRRRPSRGAARSRSASRRCSDARAARRAGSSNSDRRPRRSKSPRTADPG